MNKFLLEMFSVVVETKRITTAAKLLNITQPAVSQQIRHMESYFGVPLLERSPQGTVPTPAGVVLYRHAKEILAQFDRLEREIDDLTNAEDIEVVIGATLTVGNFALPCSLWTFKEKFPKANIRLEISSCNEIAERVLGRDLHLAIVEGPVPDRVKAAPGVKWRCISGDHLVMVTPTGSNWDKGPLTFDAIKQVPLILPGRNLGMRQVFDLAVGERGIIQKDLNVMSQLGGMEGLKSALETYGGVLLSTRMAVQKELQRGDYKEVTPEGLEMNIPFHLVCFEDALPPVARRFIRFIAAPEELASCWT